MIAIMLSRFAHFAFVVIVVLMVSAYGSDLRAQSVAAIVNGEAITNSDVDQRIKLTTLTTRKTPTRQETLEDLINDKVKLKEAKRYGIELSASDVDTAFGGMASRMRMNAEQLNKTLENSGIRPETLKNRVKAEMTWTTLVRGRFGQSLLVGEKDVQSAISQPSSSDKPQSESFEYQMRPIVLIVPRGAAPSAIEGRRKEAELLRNRIQSCDEAAELFRSMRDAAIRDNLTKTSADLPPALRELLDKTTVGRLTPPEVTKQGVEMVALCSRKPTTADTPAKREARDKLYNEKFEAKSKSYLQDARKTMMIEIRSGDTGKKL